MVAQPVDLTYICHNGLYRCIEQTIWWREGPVLEIRPKFHLRKMAQHSSHCDRAVSPRRTEVEVEEIVLNKTVPGITLRKGLSRNLQKASDNVPSRTDHLRGGQRQLWRLMVFPQHTRLSSYSNMGDLYMVGKPCNLLDVVVEKPESA